MGSKEKLNRPKIGQRVKLDPLVYMEIALHNGREHIECRGERDYRGRMILETGSTDRELLHWPTLVHWSTIAGARYELRFAMTGISRATRATDH